MMSSHSARGDALPTESIVGRHNGEKSVSDKFLARDAAWARGSHLFETRHVGKLGDARRCIEQIEPESVHLVLTSPPYWDLKQYADDHGGAQLGHIGDRDDFFDALGEVWSGCLDALVPGGRLCIVVGDVCRSRRTHGRHLVEPLHAYLQVQCQRLGYDPLAPIIWHKISNMTTEMGGSGAPLGKPYEPNAIVKNDVEFILLFRKPGGYRHPSQEQRDLSMIDRDDFRAWFRQLWTDVPGEVQRGHPAPFPIEVPRRLIGMFSFVGDTVLDPFWGTGSTTLAAMEMRRNSIGFEIEPSYFRIAARRLAQPPIGSTVELDRVPSASSEVDA